MRYTSATRSHPMEASYGHFGMGLFRELHVLLRLFVWCGLLPYVPPAPREAVRRRRAHRHYLTRIGLALLLIGVVTYVRVRILHGYIFMYTLTHIVYLLATLVDTVGIGVILIANGLSAAQFGALVEIVERLELAIDGWTLGSGRPGTYPAYGWQAVFASLLCLAYYIFLLLRNINYDVNLLLQIRWELWVTDLYLLLVFFVLFALGWCAIQLRRMLHDTVQCDAASELCRVLRLRDDLLQCVALVNRVHGVVFLSLSASWIVSITSIVYFDFLLGGMQFNIDQPFVVDHGVMLLWKSTLVGGLLAVAGAVAERIKAITTLSQHGDPSRTLQNRPLTKLIDKLLLKCQFQDIRFTVYELFPIDNSLSYMVIGTIATYLVILAQFRQLEIDNEDNRQGV